MTTSHEGSQGSTDGSTKYTTILEGTAQKSWDGKRTEEQERTIPRKIIDKSDNILNPVEDRTAVDEGLDRAAPFRVTPFNPQRNND